MKRRKKKVNVKSLFLLLILLAFIVFGFYYVNHKSNNDEPDLLDKIEDKIDDNEENDRLYSLGYSKEEINSIRKNMTDEEIEKINDYYEFLSEFSKVSYFHIENIDRYNSLKENSDYSVEEVIMRVNTNIDKAFYTDIKTIEEADDTLVLVNKFYSFEEGYVPSDLIQVEGVQMREVAGNALAKMVKDMRNEGYTINLLSGYRSEETQRGLYNRYAASDGYDEADTYSARPGHSEHQSGLAIDVSDGWYLEDYFEDTAEFNWLQENAYKYGFIMRYPKDKVYMTGYVYEPWHYRYVGEDIAKTIKEENITYEEYCVLYRGYF